MGDNFSEQYPMTDAEYKTWLVNSSSAIRMALVEVVVNVGGVETTRYLASKPFTTGAADTPANTCYLPLISGGLSFTEKLSLTDEAGLSSGDIELDNGDGSLDSWFADVWVNRSIKAWIGDPRWPRADFRMIFNGIVADIDSSARDKVNIKLRDKLQQLNTPLSENLLGGTTPNKGALRPLMFGEGHNVTPLLIDPVLKEYQFHDGAAEPGAEVRTSGKPRDDVTFYPERGVVRFLSAVGPGAVTISAHGDNTGGYTNRIAPLVQRIVTRYGKASQRFTDADVDLTNFSAFDTAHPQPVGLYLAERTNVLVACQQLASSIGAQIIMSRLGQLRIYQLALPAPGTPTQINSTHMLDKSLRPVLRLEVIAAAKIGYNRNYSVQPDLQASLPAEHKSLYATDWLAASQKDAAVVAKYRLDTEPVQIDSCLLREVDATPEAARRLALNGVPRTIYEFDGEPEMLLLELGQPLRVTYPRFGMDSGVDAVVVSLAPSWLTGRCTVGFMV